MVGGPFRRWSRQTSRSPGEPDDAVVSPRTPPGRRACDGYGVAMDFLRDVTLAGRLVTLEPLAVEHHDGLVDAVRDGELWDLWYTSVPRPEAMRAEIDRRLALRDSGTMLPFTARRSETGRIIGMTTYMNVDAANRRVEIGSTWPHPLDEPAVPRRDHPPRREAGRRAAQPQRAGRRFPAGHGRVLDHRLGVAGRPRRAPSPPGRARVSTAHA